MGMNILGAWQICILTIFSQHVLIFGNFGLSLQHGSADSGHLARRHPGADLTCPAAGNGRGRHRHSAGRRRGGLSDTAVPSEPTGRCPSIKYAYGYTATQIQIHTLPDTLKHFSCISTTFVESSECILDSVVVRSIRFD